MKQNIKKIFQKQKKKKMMNILENQQELLIIKKYGLYDRDDFDYNGIRDIENLFDEVSEEDYYKPILVKSSFEGNYKYYKSRGYKEKSLSVKQYLNKITAHLYDSINDYRIARRVWKIQISMRVNFISSKGTGQTRTIYVQSNNVKIIWGNDTDNILKNFSSLFYVIIKKS